MEQDVIGTILIVVVIAITAFVVINRIRNIKDVEPDLTLAEEQEAEVIPSTIEEASVAAVANYERYQRSKVGL